MAPTAPAHSNSSRSGNTLSINGVGVRLVPAGHILGSAQVVIEWAGRRAVVSGDYKRAQRPDLRTVRACGVRCLRDGGDVCTSGLSA